MILVQKVNEQGTRFEQIAREVLPLALQFEEILEKHKVSRIASLVADAETGYFAFSTHESKWEMSRSDRKSPAKLRYSFSKEVSLEEINEVQETMRKCGFVDTQKEA